MVPVTFKISKSTGRSVGIAFFSFFIVPIFLNQAQGKPKKAKRLAVICFLIYGHQLHYKPQKTPAELCFIKLTCSLLFIFGNEANDPTSWMTSNSIVHLSMKQSNIRYWFYCGRVYFFTVTTNGYSGMTKVEIPSTFFRDNENDLLTQINFLFPSLKIYQS